MATLDWSNCPLVEVIPGKVSGAPLLKNTRLPVHANTGNYDTLSATMDYRRTPPLLKLSTATRKLALTLSGPFLTIAPRVNFGRSPGKLARSLPRHEIHTVVQRNGAASKTAPCSN